MTDAVALGPGREFDVIRALLARWGTLARGVGDDAAVLDVPAGERLIVSTDSSVEGVHFRRDWLSPEEIGYRAVTAALSDLAAMAATPLGVTLAISLPGRWLPDIGAIADGMARAVSLAGTRIVGGDMTRASELVLGVTVLGSTAHPVGRDGARAGDLVFVTGALGGPARAVRAWDAGEAPDAASRDRFARPVARLAEGRWLAARGASAMIDISDGLLADAAHVAHASGVRLALALDALPTIGGEAVDQAALSGEEYELLVAAPPGAIDVGAFARELAIPLTMIGRVERGAPGVVATVGGARVARTGGFDHFS